MTIEMKLVDVAIMTLVDVVTLVIVRRCEARDISCSGRGFGKVREIRELPCFSCGAGLGLID